MLKPYYSKGLVEAGCDEAGRGCLAGPVFAATVILPPNYINSSLNDSKKLSEKQRNTLRTQIEKDAKEWAVAHVSPTEIDKINILNASFLAMHRAIEQLNRTPELLLIDGNRFNHYEEIPHHCIIKGDGIYQSIAAASVLAKTHRDEYMAQLHRKFPDYNWIDNKGYPTKDHREGIRMHGSTLHHRMSFQLLPAQLKLEF